MINNRILSKDDLFTFVIVIVFSSVLVLPTIFSEFHLIYKLKYSKTAVGEIYQLLENQGGVGGATFDKFMYNYYVDSISYTGYTYDLTHVVGEKVIVRYNNTDKSINRLDVFFDLYFILIINAIIYLLLIFWIRKEIFNVLFFLQRFLFNLKFFRPN